MRGRFAKSGYNVSVVLRLFAAIALVFLLSFVGGATIGYIDARQRVAAELDAAMMVGRESARRAIHALESSFRPAGHITEFVTLFDSDRHLQARLVDLDGITIRQSSLLPPENNAPAWFVRLLEPDPKVEEFALPGELSRFAKLALAADAGNEISEIWSFALVAAATLLLFMTLVLFLVAFVVWHALRPVKPLLQAMEGLGTGRDAPELRPFGPPEFQRLHGGFNAMVDRLMQTERRNHALAEQIATVQDEERAELARDLHDEVGPQLFAIDVDAAAIRGVVGKKPGEPGKQVLARAKAISASAVTIKQHVRSILVRLRPNLAADIGLEQALIDLVAGEQERHPGVRFAERLAGDCREPLASAALYAVAREAIHNALLHAKPKHINLSLTVAENRLELAVENDGGGLKNARPDSHGLRNMRHRIEALGGRFSIEELNNPSGVRVRAALPQTPSSQQAQIA